MEREGRACSRRGAPLAAIAALAGVLLATSSAHAQQGAIPNPIAARIGGDFSVAEFHVSYRDGALQDHIDQGAMGYIEQRMPAERRSEFEQFAQSRGLTRETTAERLSEFLTLQNLRTRLPARDGASRNLRIEAVVVNAHAPKTVQMALALLGGRPPPTLDATFSVIDASTGALLFTGQITGVYGGEGNIEEARRRTDLTYRHILQNFTGADAHFRTLAGLTNGLSATIQRLLQSPTLPARSTTFRGPPLPDGAPSEARPVPAPTPESSAL